METSTLLVRFLKLSKTVGIQTQAVLVQVNSMQFCKYPILQTKNFFFYTSYNSDEHTAALIYTPFTSITLLPRVHSIIAP
jgi:hypothetical protein